MRVFFSSLRCFFLAIRLRRFLTTEPTENLPGLTTARGRRPDLCTRHGRHEVISLSGARDRTKRGRTDPFADEAQVPPRVRRHSGHMKKSSSIATLLEALGGV